MFGFGKKNEANSNKTVDEKLVDSNRKLKHYRIAAGLQAIAVIGLGYVAYRGNGKGNTTVSEALPTVQQ